MHEVSVASLVEFAVDGDGGQERVFGIEGPGNSQREEHRMRVESHTAKATACDARW